jgi:uncharacterized protein (AIM24 family)
MAEFKIHHLEGMQYVDAHLQDEEIRAEAGSLSYSSGNITIHSRFLPSIAGVLRSMLSEEAIYRPTYSGSGVITMESSLGGFHMLELAGQAWILEPGTYWASEGSVKLSYHRERVLTSLWAGEGLVYLQTKVSGTGKVVVTTRGPVEMIELSKGMKIVADGKYVIGRTEGVKFSIRRATRNLLGKFTAGESMVRVYEGEGTVLLNPSPYWRYKLFTERGGNPDYPAESST